MHQAFVEKYVHFTPKTIKECLGLNICPRMNEVHCPVMRWASLNHKLLDMYGDTRIIIGVLPPSSDKIDMV